MVFEELVWETMMESNACVLPVMRLDREQLNKVRLVMTLRIQHWNPKYIAFVNNNKGS